MEAAVVVCGFGQLGYRVASLLCSLGERVTVVTLDAKSEWQRLLESNGARFVFGDAEDGEVLELAGVSTALALIACCSVDLINLQIAMEAKHIAPDLRIVLRIFDQNLARHAENELGVEAALGMAALSAPAFASAALGEDVLASFDVEDVRCGIGRIASPRSATVADVERDNKVRVLMLADQVGKIVFLPGKEEPIPDQGTIKALAARSELQSASGVGPANLGMEAVRAAGRLAFSPLDTFRFGWRLWKGTSRELRGIVVGIFVLMAIFVPVFKIGFDTDALNSFYFVVTTVTTTGYGDFTVKDKDYVTMLSGILLMLLGSFMFAVLYSLITDYFVNARLQQALGRQTIPDGNHVVIAGIGIVGYRVVEELDRLGTKVVVIEQNPSAKFLASVRARANVIMGDARDEETLNQAGIQTAAAFIACTGDDAVNLSMGLAASSINPKIRRVLRIFDADFAARLQNSFSGQTALSASRLAAPHFVANALFGKVLAAFVARDHLFALRSAGAGIRERAPVEGFVGDVEFPVNDGTATVTAYARRIGLELEKPKRRDRSPHARLVESPTT